MKNKEYWSKRAHQRIAKSHKNDKFVRRKTLKDYKKAEKNIRASIEKFYTKYAKDNAMTIAEARNKLSVQEIKRAHGRFGRYYKEIEKLNILDKNGKVTEEFEKHKAYLEDLRRNSRLSREYALLSEIQQEIIELTAKNTVTIKQDLKSRYTTHWEATVNELTNLEPKIKVRLGAPSKRKVELAIEQAWKGENFSDRLWNDKKKLVSNVKKIVAQAYTQGHDYKKLAMMMSHALNQSYYNCERIIRTEGANIAAQATAEVYRDAKIKKYRFIAGVDERLCKTCGALDGQVFELDKAVTGENYPPVHPNCRCTTVAVIDDEYEWIDEVLDEVEEEDYEQEEEIETISIESVDNNKIKARNYEEDQLIALHSQDEYRQKREKEVLDYLEKYYAAHGMHEPIIGKDQLIKENTHLINQNYEDLTQTPTTEQSIAKKIVQYSLNFGNNAGVNKARVFKSIMNITMENAEELAPYLVFNISKAKKHSSSDEFGQKYSQRETIFDKNGSPIDLVIGWIYNPDGVLRMTTCYFDGNEKRQH